MVTVGNFSTISVIDDPCLRFASTNVSENSKARLQMVHLGWARGGEGNCNIISTLRYDNKLQRFLMATSYDEK